MKNDERTTLKEKILVGESLFKKMISFINRNHYKLNWTRLYPKDENFPFSKSFRLYDGKEFMEIVYVFMDPNKCSDFEPWIQVGSNKDYGNETIDMEGFDRIKNVVHYSITKDEIIEYHDYSIGCKNLICSYNEFLEMINK